MSSTNTYTKQQWIVEQARANPERVFTSLHHLIDIEWLREAYRRTRKDSAAAEDYEKDIGVNFDDFLNRIKSGGDVVPPVRRHYITARPDNI